MLRRCGAACSVSWWSSTARAPCGSGAARGRSCWPRWCAASVSRVAVEELVDLVWGDGAPPTAATMVHGAVARLRRELAGELVGTTGGGYVVDVEVDAVAFERLMTVGPPAEVAQRSAAALALWRGAAYAGIGRPFARDEADRLEELRRRCVEQLADAELALGRPERAVPQLTALVTAEPDAGARGRAAHAGAAPPRPARPTRWPSTAGCARRSWRSSAWSPAPPCGRRRRRCCAAARGRAPPGATPPTRPGRTTPGTRPRPPPTRPGRATPDTRPHPPPTQPGERRPTRDRTPHPLDRAERGRP